MARTKNSKIQNTEWNIKFKIKNNLICPKNLHLGLISEFGIKIANFLRDFSPRKKFIEEFFRNVQYTIENKQTISRSSQHFINQIQKISSISKKKSVKIWTIFQIINLIFKKNPPSNKKSLKTFYSPLMD